MLTFLHTHGVAWDESTTKAAADADNLKCLKYAISNGCPYSEDVCFYPAMCGKTDTVEYLLSLGCKKEE